MSVKTSCEACVFAERTENEQTGCRAGRIELFQSKGTEPERMVGANDYKFFVIPDRICVMCKHKDSEWLQNTPESEWLAVARKDATIRLDAVVYCPQGTTIDDLMLTAESLAQQETPIRVAHFVLANRSPGIARTISMLEKHYGPEGRLRWRVDALNQRDKAGCPLTRGPASDIALNNVSYSDANYYILVDAGGVLWPGLARQVDEAINDRLEQFLALEPVSQHTGSGENEVLIGPMVQLRFHKGVRGNAEADHEGTACNSVLDKLRAMLANVEIDQGRMLRPMEDVCPLPD